MCSQLFQCHFVPLLAPNPGDATVIQQRKRDAFTTYYSKMMLNVSKHLLLEPCLGADFFLPRAKDKLPPSALLSLEVGPLNTARGLEERCKLPQWGLR